MKPREYIVQYGTSARLQELCDLAPPLRPTLELRYDVAVYSLPLISQGRLFLKQPSTRLECLDERTGSVVWRYRELTTPKVVYGGCLIATGASGQVEVLDAGTGALLRTIEQRGPLEAAAIAGLLIGRSHEDGARFYSVNIESGRLQWDWRPEGIVKCIFAASEEAVCVGLDEGPVLGLDPRTGRELWRESVADLTYNDLGKERPGQAEGVAIIHEGRVLFQAHRWGVVAYSVRDGRRLWAQPIPGGPSACSVYDGRYYVLSTRGQLVVIDPATGKVLSEKPLVGRVSKKETVQPMYMLLISDTHIFTGSHEGYVLAFERDGGECVWSHRAKSRASIGGYFACANGRLYYLDASFRVYCLVQEDLVENSRRARG